MNNSLLSETFPMKDQTRQILVVDDEEINRELLGIILQDQYEVLYAADGREALEKIHEYSETLSLILLDLMMPFMSGFEVLELVRKDSFLQRIPIIVLTSEHGAEVKSLQMGAIDFIPKPYPQPEVIRARVLRTIELSEDRDIIQYTERDNLTGLYNKEYFYRYAIQYDQHNREQPMDAVVIDVNHFHMINERYGRIYGDKVLKRVGEKIREKTRASQGIVCRRENDTFLLYCCHRNDYRDILEDASQGLDGEEKAGGRVRLRMGIYSNVDKSMDIERRFDRAKLAADTVKNSYNKTIAVYDETLHESELYSEQLLEDFHQALADEQFVVFFQPKFNIQSEIPVLASAEALVRWKHPKLGMISPGIFIPLFENNGLIQELDHYVWRKTAARIRGWKERLGFTLPVSVNVSRIDMYDTNLIDTLKQIIEEYSLTSGELLLEITESAYTQDSQQIIQVVNRLRDMGFKIEMDDFGTGYSSLNMISKLPIDALKLDMQFIRTAFGEKRDTRMLEVIIDIADYLRVPVIAEGVETEEQLAALKAMGCDIVQGYYFSRPVPPEEYEVFVVKRREQLRGADEMDADELQHIGTEKREEYLGNIVHALSGGFESIYYIDSETGHYIEFNSQGRYEDLQIQRSGSDFFKDICRDLKLLVFHEDRERILESLQKDRLLKRLDEEHTISLTYRRLQGDTLVYCNMKIVPVPSGEKHHIVIGVTNISAETRQTIQNDELITRSQELFNIAQALSHDFESVYYINIYTDIYTEFTARGIYENLELELSGTDFFAECRKNLQVVSPESRDLVSASLEKEYLLAELENKKVFTIDYNLLVDGAAVPYRMKIARSDGDHIVIGVCNISDEVARSKAYDHVRKRSVTYASIAQALAADYFSIYYVDTETNHFIEYSAHDDYEELGLEKSGEDFFALSERNILRVIYPEDQKIVLEAVRKENLLRELEKNGTFMLTYRLMVEGKPNYVNMKVTRMEKESDPHIVIGINSVDAQIRREEELGIAKEKANRDALTGVKSKHAFMEAESIINEEIETNEEGKFAVAVCDVNDLKFVNDTLGHQSGDQLIRDACRIICRIFQHSPVYRVGGDEFAVILRGDDYEKREKLRRILQEKNQSNLTEEKFTIAMGLAEYVSGKDTCVRNVFERADAAMYEDKKYWKSLKEDARKR